MIVAEVKCQMCGFRFELEILDREDPEERFVRGSAITCPRCHKSETEVTRRIRKAK